MNERGETISKYERVTWRKSSYSGSGGGQCVEVAAVRNLPLVRDSRDPDGPTLSFTRDEWWNLVDRIKDGGLDPN